MVSGWDNIPSSLQKLLDVWYRGVITAITIVDRTTLTTILIRTGEAATTSTTCLPERSIVNKVADAAESSQSSVKFQKQKVFPKHHRHSVDPPLLQV